MNNATQNFYNELKDGKHPMLENNASFAAMSVDDYCINIAYSKDADLIPLCNYVQEQFEGQVFTGIYNDDNVLCIGFPDGNISDYTGKGFKKSNNDIVDEDGDIIDTVFRSNGNILQYWKDYACINTDYKCYKLSDNNEAAEFTSKVDMAYGK